MAALSVCSELSRANSVCLLEDLYSRMIRMTCLSICNDMAALSKNRLESVFWSSRYLVELFLIQSRVTSSWLLICMHCTITVRVLYRMLHFTCHALEVRAFRLFSIVQLKVEKPFIKDFLILTCVVLIGVYCNNIPCTFVFTVLLRCDMERMTQHQNIGHNRYAFIFRDQLGRL